MAYYIKNQNKWRIVSSTSYHGPTKKKIKSPHVKKIRNNLKKKVKLTFEHINPEVSSITYDGRFLKKYIYM